MKTYIEFEDCLILENAYIPKDLLNRDYNEALQEVKKGIALVTKHTTVNRSTWETVRNTRNDLLKQSDWAATPDATPKPSKQAWLVYRQKLRDITKTFTKPEDVIWPELPNK